MNTQHFVCWARNFDKTWNLCAWIWFSVETKILFEMIKNKHAHKQTRTPRKTYEAKVFEMFAMHQSPPLLHIIFASLNALFTAFYSLFAHFSLLSSILFIEFSSSLNRNSWHKNNIRASVWDFTGAKNVRLVCMTKQRCGCSAVCRLQQRSIGARNEYFVHTMTSIALKCFSCANSHCDRIISAALVAIF